MGPLLILLILGLLAWSNVAIVQQFRKRRAGATWWVALSAAWLIGAALGVRSTFFFEYSVSPRVRVIGAPVPAATFLLEGPPGEEQWVDYVAPAPLVLSNILLIALLLACPVGLLFWLCGTGRSRS